MESGKPSSQIAAISALQGKLTLIRRNKEAGIGRMNACGLWESAYILLSRRWMCRTLVDAILACTFSCIQNLHWERRTWFSQIPQQNKKPSIHPEISTCQCKQSLPVYGKVNWHYPKAPLHQLFCD